jgi:hypothetical protein
MFIKIEDEACIANLVIWPDLYEKRRRVILSVSFSLKPLASQDFKQTYR